MSIIEKVIDEYLKISTERDVDRGQPGRELYSPYVPTSYQFLETLFDKIPFEEGDHLVDFGCGKGRVLFMAALNSCKQVTGYEIDEELCEILDENINNFQQKFGKGTIFNIRRDVLKMESDEIRDANKFFFFHPFHLKILIPVIKKILKSIEDNPRQISIYFFRPYKSIVGYMDSLNEVGRVLSGDLRFYSSENESIQEAPQVYVYSNQNIKLGVDEYSFSL